MTEEDYLKPCNEEHHVVIVLDTTQPEPASVREAVSVGVTHSAYSVLVLGPAQKWNLDFAEDARTQACVVSLHKDWDLVAKDLLQFFYPKRYHAMSFQLVQANWFAVDLAPAARREWCVGNGVHGTVACFLFGRLCGKSVASSHCVA